MVLCWINQMDQHLKKVEEMQGFMVNATSNHTSRSMYGTASKSLASSPCTHSLERSHPRVLPWSDALTTRETTTVRDKIDGTRFKNGKGDEIIVVPAGRNIIHGSAQENDEANQVEFASATVMPNHVLGDPRIPLGTLIARESGVVWVSGQKGHSCPTSPARKRAASTLLAGNGRISRGESVTGTKPLSQQDRQLSGSLSSKRLGTRMGQVFEKIKLFETVGMAADQQGRQPEQLGALLARERATCPIQNNCRITHFNSVRETANLDRQEPLPQVPAMTVPTRSAFRNPHPQLRTLIAEDKGGSRCARTTIAMYPRSGNVGFVGSSTRGNDSNLAMSSDTYLRRCSTNEATGPVTQQQGSFNAEDWITKKSPDNAAVRDSSSVVTSCEDSPLRSRSSDAEKVSSSSNQRAEATIQPAITGELLNTISDCNSDFSSGGLGDGSVQLTTRSKIINPAVQELHLQSSEVLGTSLATCLAQEDASLVQDNLKVESADPGQQETRPSLGALLAAELASACGQKSGGAVELRGDEGYGSSSDGWSVAGNADESDRDLQLPTVNMIARSVRSEPQGQLEAIFGRFLKPRTNKMERRASSKQIGNDISVGHEPKLSPTSLIPKEVAGSCSLSSTQVGNDVSLGHEPKLSPCSLIPKEDAGSCSLSTQMTVNLREIDEVHMNGQFTTTESAGAARGIDGDTRFKAKEITNHIVQKPECQYKASNSKALDPCALTRSQTPNLVRQKSNPRLGVLIAEEHATTGAEMRRTVSETGLGERRCADSVVHSNGVIDNPQGDMVSEVLQEPRVQLGTLLEQTWGEHGWLPLGRSRIGSPLLRRNQSSGTLTSRFDRPRQGISNGISASPSLEVDGVRPRPLLASETDFSNIGNSTLSAGESSPCPQNYQSPVVQVSVDLPTRAGPVASPGPAVISTHGRANVTPPRERAPTRVSLMSLLNQDMDMDENPYCDGKVAGDNFDGDGDDDQTTEELDPMCCVCMVGHKGAAFIPCGHTFCRKCCREVRRSLRACPLCNHAIHDILNIY